MAFLFLAEMLAVSGAGWSITRATVVRAYRCPTGSQKDDLISKYSKFMKWEQSNISNILGAESGVSNIPRMFQISFTALSPET